MAADASRLAALLLAYIGLLCALVAPCQPGASTPKLALLFPSGSLELERCLTLRVPWGSSISSGEPGQDDVRLIGAAREGDRTAFGELYRRYARMIHGVLLARVPYGDVDDLVQDVFLQAMERLDTLRDAGAFRGWLATIARNRATDHLRRAPQTTELPEDLPSNESADHVEAAAALAIIRTLPEAYRETLILRLVEGFTGPEIAAQTGLTEGSVRVNLHRGMKQLRERLEQHAAPARDGRDGRDDGDVKDERT